MCNKEFSPDIVIVGNDIWMAKNLAIDDGKEGIYKNPKNGEYYYTWEAAMRVARAVDGWHVATDDDLERALEYLGVNIWDTRIMKADALCQALKIKYCGNHTSGGFIGENYACFWTGTACREYFSIGYMVDTSGNLVCYPYVTHNGRSVRLVKDSEE